jgi:hypothetical protein
MGTGIDGNLETGDLGEIYVCQLIYHFSCFHIGIVPRAIEEIFKRLFILYPYPNSNSDNPSERPYNIYASFIEIYNEEVKDLLSQHKSGSSNKPHLVIREDASGEIYLAGCTEDQIRYPADLFK